jgi:hypothetical protein
MARPKTIPNADLVNAARAVFVREGVRFLSPRSGSPLSALGI